MEHQIKTRPDGSIDTAFYLARGREARSTEAHRMTEGAGRAAVRTTGLLAALAALFTFRSGGA